MYKRVALFYFLISVFSVFSAYSLAETFLYNPLVPAETWLEVEPYFFPFNHPLRRKLDSLFSAYRVTSSVKTFKKGGFHAFKLRKQTNIVVGRHLKIPHYLFKVYLDSQPPVDEWNQWIKRIKGAQAIKKCIKKHQFKHFVVPKKWIYPLPLSPFFSKQIDERRKNFILIVEEVALLDQKENRQAYQEKITFSLLDELFILLKEVGLIDSVYIDNIPFTKEGKIAFIDTEHHHLTPVPYSKLTPYLAPQMQSYWKNLTSP